jgi:signal recognition particle GTPase
MSYTRVTADQFILKVQGGKYKRAVDAQRAIGKSALSDDEKASCYKAIDEYDFSGSKARAQKKKTGKSKKKATKAVKKKATKKKVAKKKTAQKKKATKKKSTKGATKKKKATRAATASTPAPTNSKGVPLFQDTEKSLAEINLASEQVGTIAQSLKAMQMAKEVNPEIDMGTGPQSAADALTTIVKNVHESARAGGDAAESPNTPDPKVLERFDQSAPVATGIPGQEQPSNQT